MATSHSLTKYARLRKIAAALTLLACFGQESQAQVTITVNTTQQGITNGQCSLQEAIYASEFKSNIAIRSTSPDSAYTTGCMAGTGDGDTIVLPAGAIFTFDHFWEGDAYNKFGPTATPIIFSKIIIEGNGATLQWQDTFSPGNSRLFAIGSGSGPFSLSGTGNLMLSNVYVKGFHIKGGDADPYPDSNVDGGGGGGGLGAGGAIYVSEGSLTIDNSTFDNNGAVGGNGGRGRTGGGGGLSGKGGEGTNSCNGGGGGGSRGDGGRAFPIVCPDWRGGGAGGGGTVFMGGSPQDAVGGSSGDRCGGTGGDSGNDGSDGACPGGGGGGGGVDLLCYLVFVCAGRGGSGSYGGGGGGGGSDGGDGGFGGGGGSAGASFWFRLHGGNGGFGGGGGAASCSWCFSHPGRGGAFGGSAYDEYGGGGGALGGAIFNHNGTVVIRNSTFLNNYVTRGNGGGGSADNGADAGGAIFSLDNVLEVTNSTFSGNQATGSGAAIVVYSDEGDEGGPGGGGAPVSFILNNTIIANNGANECFFTGSMNVKGAGNLIMFNGSGTGQFSPCPGMVVFSDPQLQSLQLNSPGNTPTMAIFPSSSAFNKADPATSLSRDQRGVPRNLGGRGFDIGAYQVLELGTKQTD